MYLEFHPFLPSGLVKILWFYRVPRLWGDVHYPNMGVLSGPPLLLSCAWDMGSWVRWETPLKYLTLGVGRE